MKSLTSTSTPTRNATPTSPSTKQRSGDCVCLRTVDRQDLIHRSVGAQRAGHQGSEILRSEHVKTVPLTAEHGSPLAANVARQRLHEIRRTKNRVRHSTSRDG